MSISAVSSRPAFYFNIDRRLMRGALAASCAAAIAGCSAARPHPAASASSPAALERISAGEVRVPATKDLPPLVGRMQSHQVRHGDTLLDVARDAGLGFQEIKDANPAMDEWIPPVDATVVVPTWRIVPRSHYRGLVLNIPEMRLYVFPKNARAGDRVLLRTWPVSIGVDEAPSPIGRFSIRSKEKNPTWGVPDSIYKIMDEPRRHVVPPGPDNPLGAYRLRLSEGLYAIHGTNNPWSIGRKTTNGCIRLYPEDLEILFPMVEVGEPVEFVYEPVKIGEAGGQIYVEVHSDVYKKIPNLEKHATALLQRAGLAHRINSAQLKQALKEKRGVPVAIGSGSTATLIEAGL